MKVMQMAGRGGAAAVVLFSLALAACAPATEPDAGTGAAEPTAAEEAMPTEAADATQPPDAAEGAAGDAEAAATPADADATGAVSDTVRPGMGMGMGGQMGDMHQRMQALMHRAMLDETVAQDLLDADDVALFTKVHAAIDPYRPVGSGMGMNMTDETRKAMQRGFVAQAVADGKITQAEADRFTEIHDLLIDKGIMGRFESLEASPATAAPDDAYPAAPVATPGG